MSNVTAAGVVRRSSPRSRPRRRSSVTHRDPRHGDAAGPWRPTLAHHRASSWPRSWRVAVCGGGPTCRSPRVATTPGGGHTRRNPADVPPATASREGDATIWRHARPRRDRRRRSAPRARHARRGRHGPSRRRVRSRRRRRRAGARRRARPGRRGPSGWGLAGVPAAFWSRCGRRRARRGGGDGDRAGNALDAMRRCRHRSHFASSWAAIATPWTKPHQLCSPLPAVFDTDTSFRRRTGSWASPSSRPGEAVEFAAIRPFRRRPAAPHHWPTSLRTGELHVATWADQDTHVVLIVGLTTSATVRASTAPRRASTPPCAPPGDRPALQRRRRASRCASSGAPPRRPSGDRTPHLRRILDTLTYVRPSGAQLEAARKRRSPTAGGGRQRWRSCCRR